MTNAKAKLLLAATILALVALGMWLFIRSLNHRVDPASVEVHRGPFEIHVKASGVLKAETSVPVSVRPRGQVLVWLLPEGSMVAKGDLLGRFDDMRYRDGVDQNKTDLDIAGAKLRQRQEELRAAEEDFKAKITMLEADKAAVETDLKRLRSLPRKQDLQRAQLDLDYAAKSLEAAEAEYERFQKLSGKGVVMTSELKQKEMAVISARADKDTALIEYRLVHDGATPQDLETARLKDEQVRIDLGQARKELPAQMKVCDGLVTEARSEVEKAQGRLDEARASLDAMQVKSPAEGMLVHRTISGRKVEIGTSFWESANLFDVVDVSRMFVRVKVLEGEIRSVKEGQQAEVRVVTIPDRVLKGRVAKIAKVGKDKSEDELMTWREMRSKAGIQAFDVEVAIDETDPRLRPNVSADVSILVDKLDNVIRVPVDSVFKKDAASVVRVLTWRGPVLRPVKLGPAGNDWIVVNDGLAERDRVLLSVPDGSEGLEDFNETAPGSAATVSAPQKGNSP